MSLVPVVVTPPAPSPKANELGSRLTDTIERFRRENPTLSPTEIRQAMSLAMREAGTGGTIASALAAAFLIFGALVFFYFARGGLDFGGQPLILMTLVGAGVVALAILAATLKNR